jgi:hypothetical protein
MHPPHPEGAAGKGAAGQESNAARYAAALDEEVFVRNGVPEVIEP